MFLKIGGHGFFSSPSVCLYYCYTFPLKARRGLQNQILVRQNFALSNIAQTLTPCCLNRVGHRVLFRAERSVLFRSFKERNVLLRSFFEFLA